MNENKITRRAQESALRPIESHGSEKDGIFTRRLATQAGATISAKLRGQFRESRRSWLAALVAPFDLKTLTCVSF